MSEKNRYATKKKGKTEVYPFWYMKDIKNMMDYFKDNQLWDEYLIFMLGLLLGRRIGDTVSMEWLDLYYENGNKKNEIRTIEEQKTGKTTIIPISPMVFDAIATYCDATGIVPQEHLGEYIFSTPSKEKWIERKDNEVYKVNNLDLWCEFLNKDFTEKRKHLIVEDFKNQKDYLSLGEYLYNVVEFKDIVKWHTDVFRKKFDIAAKHCEIDYAVSCHSLRKTFGYISKMIHPQDPNSLETLQDIFNHANVATTIDYIGLGEQRKRKYFDDMGDVIRNIENGDTDLQVNNSPIVSLTHEDLRTVLMFAIQNKGVSDIDVFNQSMNMVDEMKLKII